MTRTAQIKDIKYFGDFKVERKFTLDGWQWRKYKTRDNKDARIVAVSSSKHNLVAEIEGDLITHYDVQEGLCEHDEDDDYDLFDVPDQKEPEHYFIYYGIKGINIHPIFVQNKLSKEDAGVDNRIKVYLEEGRWDK